MTDLLLQARDVLEHRQQQYGPAGLCITKIAELWSAYLRIPVSTTDVCLLMGLLKIARESQSHQQDNLIDIIGYATLAGELITRKEVSK